MKKLVETVYPKYLKEFKCIGGACEDTCCINWEIYVDKDTFKKYENIKDTKLRKYITENIFKRKSCENDNSDYGQIKFNNKKVCPFLDSANYCYIQKSLGEEYLGNVCTNFPRIINKIDDIYEVSLDVSCIEAAKIVLLKEEGIVFEKDNMILKNNMITDSIDTRSDAFEYTNTKYMKQIRNMSIKIIKNRNYTINERLNALGKFLHDIESELCYNYFGVNKYIKKYNINLLNIISNKSYMDYMMQISFHKKLLEKLNGFGYNISDEMKEIIRNTENGFMFNDGRSLMEKHNIYVKAYIDFNKEEARKYSYIFENYLVNHIFKELFPFSESDVIFDDYIMLIIRFSFIRFLLIGSKFSGVQLSKEKITKIIQIFSKEIEHNSAYLKDVRKYIKEYELYTERFAKILL